LHLLLYVTPMLYVDGIGEDLKQFKQPPRIIAAQQRGSKFVNKITLMRILIPSLACWRFAPHFDVFLGNSARSANWMRTLELAIWERAQTLALRRHL
jgi:hypothetical protein